ncbi:thioredoxin family protein [Fibrisoma montanum]|uniref:Thioredoxin family protein n=1 Tax=Fibrisoma montanum TaxID=2305895 RepID=A0A418MBE8_9BACT|nr:thioredoxin family protein [Fibrisoma montanum]RIV23670.1 thioredoxin family protein [Fibrisoma montanum]
MSTASPSITHELIASAYTYDQYVTLSADLLAQGRTTSESPGYNTPEVLGFTKLNLHRMSRVGRFTVIQPELAEALQNVPERWIWLVLTESWCGDAAQILPVLQRMTDLTPNVQMRLILRDKHLDVMDAYLTNGTSRSIPKLICLNADTLAERGTWGPRPAALQALVMQWKAEKRPYAETAEQTQRWYNDDRAESLQHEMLFLIRQWAKISV